MGLLVVAAAALLGLLVGSFLNVCIHRIPRSESIVWPGSHCPACGAAIAWHHNVPLVGFLLLRGRCAHCRGRISVQYPVVEAATALLFVVHLLEFGPTPLFVVRLAFACAMLVLFAIDLEHQILPNVVTLPGIVVGLAASMFLEPGLVSAAIGALLGGGILWAIAEVYLRARGIEGMGMGDVKMLAMIGAFLGWPLMIVTLVAASFGGAAVGLAMIAARGKSMQYALPFGTFLAIAAVAASLWGQPFVDWYAGLYR